VIYLVVGERSFLEGKRKHDDRRRPRSSVPNQKRGVAGRRREGSFAIGIGGGDSHFRRGKGNGLSPVPEKKEKVSYYQKEQH